MSVCDAASTQGVFDGHTAFGSESKLSCLAAGGCAFNDRVPSDEALTVIEGDRAKQIDI